MQRKLVAAGAAVLALAAAGCGSSGSSGPKPLKLTGDFQHQAAQICTYRRAAYRRAAGRSRGNFLATIRAALPALQDSIKQLETIAPPANLRAAYAEIMAFERRQLRLGQQAAKTGRIPQHAEEHGPPLHRHERMRAQLGMTACN
jgi:hypothetical protein